MNKDETTFFDRLKREREELMERLVKLLAFLETEKFRKLDDEMRQLLICQGYYMRCYANILTRRIEIIEKEDCQ